MNNDVLKEYENRLQSLDIKQLYQQKQEQIIDYKIKNKQDISYYYEFDLLSKIEFLFPFIYILLYCIFVSYINTYFNNVIVKCLVAAIDLFVCIYSLDRVNSKLGKLKHTLFYKKLIIRFGSLRSFTDMDSSSDRNYYNGYSENQCVDSVFKEFLQSNSNLVAQLEQYNLQYEYVKKLKDIFLHKRVTILNNSEKIIDCISKIILVLEKKEYNIAFLLILDYEYEKLCEENRLSSKFTQLLPIMHKNVVSIEEEKIIENLISQKRATEIYDNLTTCPKGKYYNQYKKISKTLQLPIIIFLGSVSTYIYYMIDKNLIGNNFFYLGTAYFAGLLIYIFILLILVLVYEQFETKILTRYLQVGHHTDFHYKDKSILFNPQIVYYKDELMQIAKEIKKPEFLSILYNDYSNKIEKIDNTSAKYLYYTYCKLKKAIDRKKYDFACILYIKYKKHNSRHFDSFPNMQELYISTKFKNKLDNELVIKNESIIRKRQKI